MYYTGCEFTSDYVCGTLKETQTANSIDRLVDKYDVSTSISTLAVASVPSRPRKEDEEGLKGRYSEALGGLFCIVNSKRPDVANVVREVASQAHNPSIQH